MNKLNTPVLFLIFNRLDTTKQVFEEIRKSKPKKLYIAADGPRNKVEKKKTDVVRKYVLDNIDWNCEVKTLFRKKNLGCGKAVSRAITWFFKNEEKGIILEDDCLPSQSFFPFCEELLKKYKNDERIMHISGFNPVSKNKYSDADYFFSKTPSIWGWATWRRAWNKYDFYMHDFNKFEKNKKIENIFFNKKLVEGYLNVFNLVINNKIDTWDYQWVYSIFKNDGLGVYPSKNLVKNIGFGFDSTNNKGSGKRFLKMTIFDMKFPLNIQKNVVVIKKFDDDMFFFMNRPFFKKIYDFIKFNMFS